MTSANRTAKVALLCDLHLPLLENTAPYATLRWAVNQMIEQRANFCFTLGDITAHGSVSAAARFVREMEALSASPVSPLWAAVAGNADLRDPSTLTELCNILASKEPKSAVILKDSGWRAVLLDSSTYCLNTIQRQKLLQALAALQIDEKLLLLLHHAPKDLDRESEDWLKNALNHLSSGRLLIAHGHQHRPGRGCWEGFPLLSLQALDPDKAIGTPPGFSVLTLTPEGWGQEEILWPPDPDAVKDMEEQMGISCFDVFGDLDYAIQKKIALVELRQSHLKNLPEELLLQKIAFWRGTVGRYLSLHMAEPGWASGVLTGLDSWMHSIYMANRLDADAVTLHTPNTALSNMEEGSPVWDQLLRLTVEGLEQLPRGCEIHIENMHMNPGDLDDGTRRFGCLPQEVSAWIDALQAEFSQPERLSFLLDVGHARNNTPYSQVYTLSMWYAIMGGRTGGCHLHQVLLTENGMKNHQAITDFYGPLINFTSFVWSWKEKMVRRCPLFLEVRSRANAELSRNAWKAVRGILP